MKGHMQDGKFHPHTDHKKGVRKKRLDYTDKELVQNIGVKLHKNNNGTIVRMKRDLPDELSRFENINMIKDKGVRQDLIQTLQKLNRVFIKNDMDGGMLWSFLGDCVNGQIQISLDKKPDHYVNSLSDFYIDDRVGFNGRKELRELLKELKERMRPIVKYDKARFVVGDVVRPNPESANVSVGNALEKKPDIKFKIMEMERGLDPHYIGYQVVDVDVKPFKKNWIYAGNDSLSQGDIL